MAESELNQILRERVIRPASSLDLQRAEVTSELQFESLQCRQHCSDSNSASCTDTCERAVASCIAQVQAQYAVPVSRFQSCLAACKTDDAGLDCISRCAKSFSAHCQSCHQVVQRIAQTCKGSS